jgi:hypothetical protein
LERIDVTTIALLILVQDTPRLPSAAGLHEFKSTTRSGHSCWVYVSSGYRPGAPAPLVLAYGKYYDKWDLEASGWRGPADAGGWIAIGTCVGKNEWGGNFDLTMEFYERAAASYSINPYAVMITCRGIDQVWPCLTKRPDLFRYACQRDGWNKQYSKPQPGDPAMLATCHVRMKMRWGKLEAAYNEASFKQATEAFEAFGLKSLLMDKRERYGDGIAEAAAWFKEKLAADGALISSSIGADQEIKKAQGLAQKGKTKEALKILEGLASKKGKLLPQAMAKVERELAALKP